MKRHRPKIKKMRLAPRASHKTGLAPGTLTHPIGYDGGSNTSFTVIHYTPETYNESNSAPELLSGLKQDNKVTWLNIEGLPSVADLEKLGEIFNLHRLTMEDILNTGHQPKLDYFNDYNFTVLKHFIRDDSTGESSSDQVSLILFKRMVITISEKKLNIFSAVKKQLSNVEGRMRKMGADYLYYSLLDSIVDSYALLLENQAERLENLEDAVMDNSRQALSAEIHNEKRKVILLRRLIWPLRDIVNKLKSRDVPFIEDTTIIYFRDLYDHTIQVTEVLETFRYTLTSILEMHISNDSNRMNEAMRVLTIISTLFIPLGFLAGLYGMNFKYMPELEYRWGYPVLLGAMGIIVITFFIYFKKRKWL